MALALSRDNLAYLEDVSGLYGQETALVGVEKTLINHTVPAGEEHILVSVIIGGNDRGRFIVKINSVEELRVRNAWTDRTKEQTLGNLRIQAGDNLTISVINDGLASNTFEARVNAKKL